VAPYAAKIYTFDTHTTAYKKQGAPDWWSLTQQKNMFFYMCSTAYKKQGTPDWWSLTQ
jgi:hypothetical protein